MIPPPTLYTPPQEETDMFLVRVRDPADRYIPSKCEERSAALVIGLNYRDTPMALSGCINDAINVRDMLISKGYDVKLLTDDNVVVTKRDICIAFMELLLHSTATRLYFHFSGHGSQVLDSGESHLGDEADGLDECLVLMDGIILDDELRGMLCCLDQKKRLMCVLDCCHSGTGMDLKYTLYESFGGGSSRKNRFHRDGTSQLSTRGEVLLLSGCQDGESSADMFIRGQTQGALTACLLRTIKRYPKITFIEILRRCRDELKTLGCGQYPIFSSGRRSMDINRVFDY